MTLTGLTTNFLTPVCIRYFLGATISKPDVVDSSYEAALVLWSKDGANDTISVLEVVSFWTTDLYKASKDDWREHRQDRLPAVSVDQWRRPENADATPVVVPTSSIL